MVWVGERVGNGKAKSTIIFLFLANNFPIGFLFSKGF
jgi:hypothetical protein